MSDSDNFSLSLSHHLYDLTLFLLHAGLYYSTHACTRARTRTHKHKHIYIRACRTDSYRSGKYTQIQSHTHMHSHSPPQTQQKLIVNTRKCLNGKTSTCTHTHTSMCERERGRKRGRSVTDFRSCLAGIVWAVRPGRNFSNTLLLKPFLLVLLIPLLQPLL